MQSRLGSADGYNVLLWAFNGRRRCCRRCLRLSPSLLPPLSTFHLFPFHPFPPFLSLSLLDFLVPIVLLLVVLVLLLVVVVVVVVFAALARLTEADAFRTTSRLSYCVSSPLIYCRGITSESRTNGSMARTGSGEWRTDPETFGMCVFKSVLDDSVP